METLIVKINKQNKAAFTKELLKSFDFLEVTAGNNKQQPNGISVKRKSALKKGFKELQLAEAGKLKVKSASRLLKELKNA